MIKTVTKSIKSLFKTILFLIANTYKTYKYKSLVEDPDGNVYYCNYRDVDMLLKHRNLELAYDRVQALAACGIIKKRNPKYVVRDIATRYPKYIFKIKTRKVPVFYKVKKALKAFSINFKKKVNLLFRPSNNI